MIGEIAQHALSKEVIEGINERTGGVPLFVEEVTRLLLERGEQGGIQAIPPTLQQSLAARLDRLGPAREIVQIGAVLGRDFSYSLLSHVAELNELALQTSLERLAEADMLFVEGAPPQVTYRFKQRRCTRSSNGAGNGLGARTCPPNNVFCSSCDALHSTQVCGVSATPRSAN